MEMSVQVRPGWVRLGSDRMMNAKRCGRHLGPLLSARHSYTVHRPRDISPRQPPAITIFISQNATPVFFYVIQLPIMYSWQ